MIKHMIIQVSHKRHKVSSTQIMKFNHQKDKRDQKQHSLSKPMIYTFFSPFGNKLPKSSQKCIVLNDSQAWSSYDGVEMAPRTKASIDVAGAGGVGVGAGGTEAVAGADDVALVSGTSTAANLCPLGTLAKASVVDLPFLSSTSS